MDYGGARILAAAFRAHGVDARVVPPSDAFSISLGGKCTSGDECYPTKITLGDFLAILEKKVVPREKAAFFMATADGPCRFGQYYNFIRRALDDQGYKDVPMYSLTSKTAYHGVGSGFERLAWRGLVASDVLRRFLHMIRPYAENAADVDGIYEEEIETVCDLVASGKAREMNALKGLLQKARGRFLGVRLARPRGSLPLIGVLGEIFCRLNTFSNEDVIRKIEQHGAECMLVGVAEWILYTNADEIRRLSEQKRRFSKAYLKAVIKRKILLMDEHRLLAPFKKDFEGRDGANVYDLLNYSLPYLPWYGSLGEMTLSIGSVIHYNKIGCAGAVDIASFACMNEIVAEAVFPKVSKDLKNFPIKVFYFEGTSTNLDRDIEIFLELARNYAQKAKDPH
jgi:predicted nucleotide-binding protein (sugar kinase/HSP70/actin superfamily)